MPKTMKDLMFCLRYGRRKRRRRAWNVVLLAMMRVIWIERSRRAFGGIDVSFTR